VGRTSQTRLGSFTIHSRRGFTDTAPIWSG